MKTLTFGIEIETVAVRREVIAEAIAGAVGGTTNSWEPSVTDTTGRTWKVVNDASLSGSVNGEVVSPILRYEDLGTLLTVVRALASAGCRIDASTAIHIHVGTRGIGTRALTNLMKMVFKNERLIEHALGVQPARLARFCRPVDESFIQRIERSRPRTEEALNRAWYGRLVSYPNRYDNSRYQGVSLNSHYYRGTTEFRFFEGTLDPDKVQAYVQFALALVATARDAKSTSSERRVFNPETAKYDFRCFLLRLGFVGAEFKTARKHLLARLGGSAAWKGARRDRRAVATTADSAEGDGGRVAA